MTSCQQKKLQTKRLFRLQQTACCATLLAKEGAGCKGIGPTLQTFDTGLRSSDSAGMHLSSSSSISSNEHFNLLLRKCL